MDVEYQFIRKMRLETTLLSLVEVSYKSGPVWKRNTDIRLLLSDEKNCVMKALRVPAFEELGMMTSQSLSKQPLMCRQVSQQIYYQVLSPSRTNPATSWKASAPKRSHVFATKYRNPASLNSFAQRSRILRFGNLPLLLRPYE
jgi:hypothetical protein